MFCLPPPRAPLAVLLPSIEQFHLVPSEPSSRPDQSISKRHKTVNGNGIDEASCVALSADETITDSEREDGLTDASKVNSAVVTTSRPVHLKGFASVKEFLATRGGVAVSWFLEDSPHLWEAAGRLSLNEAAMEGSRSSGGIGPMPQVGGPARSLPTVGLKERLNRRFLFKPCPLLERWVEAMEMELAEQRYSANKLLLGSSGQGGGEAAGKVQTLPGARRPTIGSDLNISSTVKPYDLGGFDKSHGEGRLYKEEASCNEQDVHHQRRRFLLRLRALEPGCGSGRNLAWLAARETSVQLRDGTWADISWEVVGLDFW